MACEGDDEASANASTRQMQTVGSTFVAVENEGSYHFGVQAPVQHLPSPNAHLVQSVEAGRQSMLELLQAPHDVRSFAGFGQGPFNPNQGAMEWTTTLIESWTDVHKIKNNISSGVMT